MKTNKIKLRNQYTWTHNKKENENPEGESETIQGDALSIQEMFNRLAAGMPVSKKQNAIYLDNNETEDHDQEDMEKLREADIFERNEAIKEAQETTEIYEVETRKRLDEKSKENKQKKIEKTDENKTEDSEKEIAE